MCGSFKPVRLCLALFDLIWPDTNWPNLSPVWPHLTAFGPVWLRLDPHISYRSLQHILFKVENECALKNGVIGSAGAVIF